MFLVVPSATSSRCLLTTMLPPGQRGLLYERQTMPKIKLACDNCGKEIERWPCEIGKCNYCNRRCMSQARSPKVTVICEHCGKKIKRQLSKITRSQHHYCNRKCWSNGSIPYNKNQIDLPCDWCGASLHRSPSQVREYNFCNEYCFGQWCSQYRKGPNNSNWKGGVSHTFSYGPNWQVQRARARGRDYYCCRVCGMSEKELKSRLDAHHLIPFRQFDSYKVANHLVNLVAVCRGCHNKLEPMELKQQITLIVLRNKKVVTRGNISG